MNSQASTKGCIEALKETIESCGSGFLRSQCLEAVGNIAGDSAQIRDLVMKFNMFPLVLDLLKKQELSSEELESATFCIQSLLQDPEPPISEWEEVYPVLYSYIEESEDAVSCILTALTAFRESERGMRVERFHTHGYLPHIIDFLMCGSPKIKKHATNIMSDIVSEGYTIELISLNVLPVMKFILDSQIEDEHVLLAICYILSNMIAERDKNQLIIDCGLVGTLIYYFRTHSSEKVRYEATWALCNISVGTKEEVEYFLSKGGAYVYCHALRNPRTKNLGIEAIQNTIPLIPESVAHFMEHDILNTLRTMPAYLGVPELIALIEQHQEQINLRKFF